MDGSPTGGGSAELMVAEARRAFFVMLGFLVVVWALQLVNWLDGYRLDAQFGLVAQSPGRLGGIVTAPLLHANWAHLEGNSGPLFIFGFLSAYRGVKRFLGLTLLVALTSGAAVWLFEDGGVVTVGASGLIFGWFGYVVLRGVFDRHLIDTLVGVVMAASFAYLLLVAVPGTPGVSWLGHLGGLVGGLAGAWIFRERRRPGAAGGAPAAAVSGPRSAPSGGPRADLHKELDDLGLL
ncbi:rhomboid family intramembrane serine protease [Streptacidiphilus griseoplanus]|uniref:rhomboid family intramembrane serine protease n=1 Tax=Peterkaempfera griseoplana TaxID=66896 RepID=UPI0006E22091|nr:rhomboid family intramembrane serine protease [Peterkaempfera griseoplana]